MKISRTARRLGLAAAAVLVASFTMVVVNQAGPASAHGSVTNPPSRNYGCYERWGSDHLNPTMAQTDPMCWQAWQANPNTMWNWNGLYRENVGGNHQAAVPDGQLCSGGRTQNGLYASLDAVGAWTAKSMPNNFTLTLTDGAKHGADYMLIYITKQGFDPTTQPLTWNSLELVLRTGSYPTTGLYEAQVNAGNRTGRHVVYTIWQASHLDQPYYLCSDVIFGGGNNPPPTTPPPTTAPPAGSGACTATYRKTSEWSGGFGADVTVQAGNAAISGWTVAWTWPNGQSITNAWNATVTSSGSSVSASNVAYNGSLSANASTSFGFNASWNGTNSAPTLTCTAR
ncbi:lytic polysaccharide monooxygenase auxiliary activity family 9 protein [Micromonospora chalcea]|uniref:lytic polysaccharide monooxygenase auxiliary activity family 9 protein n=1 Tax=Micromonospora chalcea TaxID=1874 RepID=UPI000CE2CFF0|nr:lytic polysaccharide monooxygenase [Micromonospora chalcea]PPA62081.1 cellulose-binding protein [Micromonospora chalcea]